jgi:hypothetical protein
MSLPSDTPAVEKSVEIANHGGLSAGERRRAALAEVDEAKFSWFHAKACIVAGK